MSNFEEILNKLNDMNEDYNQESLVTDNEIDKETKLKILYEYGKKFGYGQSSAWTEAIELTLDILGVEVEGIR